MAEKKEKVSGKDVLKIAGKGLKTPGALSTDDIQSVCASVVSQAETIKSLNREIAKLNRANRPQRGN